MANGWFDRQEMADFAAAGGSRQAGYAAFDALFYLARWDYELALKEYWRLELIGKSWHAARVTSILDFSCSLPLMQCTWRGSCGGHHKLRRKPVREVPISRLRQKAEEMSARRMSDRLYPRLTPLRLRIVYSFKVREWSRFQHPTRTREGAHVRQERTGRLAAKRPGRR